MRGPVIQQTAMLSLTTTDDLVPADHPIRRIKPIVEATLAKLNGTFNKMYASEGRPSVPPEHLLKATVLMAMYSIRSHRQFCERLRYDMLFKWFLDLGIESPGWVDSTFSKNQERLLQHDVADRFFATVVKQARLRRYMSDEHFTVDGTLLEAWASVKSFKPRDGSSQPNEPGRNPSVDFHGEKRRNDTHVSTTDPEARLMRKSKAHEAKMQFSGHVLMENRHGLITDMEVTEADGYAERDTALALLRRNRQGKQRRTVGADKAYDTQDFVEGCRKQGVVAHVAQNTSGRQSAIDGRVTRHPGYLVSQKLRKRVEEIFGWTKTVGGGRKLRFIGRKRNRSWALLTGATYNLIRIANLDAQAEGA